MSAMSLVLTKKTSSSLFFFNSSRKLHVSTSSTVATNLRCLVNKKSGGLYLKTLSLNFARIPRGRKPSGKSESALAPPPSEDLAAAWSPVTDPATGGIYWWNTVSNEVTHVNAPKPLGGTLATSPNYALQPQQATGGPLGAPAGGGGGMLSGLGGVMAQGMAFGAGSAVAHNVIGSMFNSGGGGHSDSGSGGGDDGGDSWEV